MSWSVNHNKEIPYVDFSLFDYSHFVSISLSLGEERGEPVHCIPSELIHACGMLLSRVSMYRLHGDG